MSQAEQDLRIDYVEFPASDIAATKRFYSEVFGWHFEDYGPDYVSFHDGRLRGGFAKAGEVKSGGPLVVIYTSSLEAMEAAVKKAGGTVVKGIRLSNTTLDRASGVLTGCGQPRRRG